VENLDFESKFRRFSRIVNYINVEFRCWVLYSENTTA